MGRGEIISGGNSGQYQVKIVYNRDRYNAVIATLGEKRAQLVENRIPIQSDRDSKSAEVNTAVSALNVLVDELADLYTELELLQSQLAVLRNQLTILENEDPPDLDAIAAKREEVTAKQNEIADKEEEIEEKVGEVEEKQKEANDLSFELALLDQQLAEIDLEITAINKRKETLANNMPDDETVSAWCADLTEDLSGYVGTIEVPGELGTLQIQPGYEDNAVYDQDRDGQLFPTVSMTPAQAYYNAAMLPGWQKWQPVFRHGTITAIDHDANTASVALDAITSSAQALDINRVSSLVDVDIDYMFCDSRAFDVDDEVLIMFSATAEMTARFSALNTLRSELGVLLKDLADLRNELYDLEVTTLAQMIADLGNLQNQLIAAEKQLAVLLSEDPPDEDAIALQQALIASIEANIVTKNAEIESHEEDIEAKEAEITSKQDEVNAKKIEIKAKIDEIKANIADLAVPKIIGFKDNPQSCAGYTGILASTHSYASLEDDNIYEWRQGDSASSATIFTPLPGEAKDFNNAWSKGSKIKIGASWKYPWLFKEGCDIKMKLAVSIKIYNESGSTIASIPIRVRYQGSSFTPKDKVIAGGDGSLEYINSYLLHGPFDTAYYTSEYDWNCPPSCRGVKVWEGVLNTQYWDVYNLNGEGSYQLDWQAVNMTWVLPDFTTLTGLEAEDVAGYSISGLGDEYECHSPGCTTLPGSLCDDKEDVGYTDYVNLTHEYYDGDLEALYLEQSWSMEGTITEDGVTLTDTSGGSVVVEPEEIILPFGKFIANNATQGEKLFTSVGAISDIHHVGFSITGYLTDQDTVAAIVETQYPNRHYIFNNDPYTIEYSEDGEIEFYCVIHPG